LIDRAAAGVTFGLCWSTSCDWWKYAYSPPTRVAKIMPAPARKTATKDGRVLKAECFIQN